MLKLLQKSRKVIYINYHTQSKHVWNKKQEFDAQKMKEKRNVPILSQVFRIVYKTSTGVGGDRV